MVAMTTQRALLQFTALAALVLAPVAAARLIAPEGMWASEPYLELAHRDIPDLLAGVFHGGFSLKTPKNSSADKSQYIFVDYFAVDQMGKFWGMYKPIVGPHLDLDRRPRSGRPVRSVPSDTLSLAF